MGGTARGLPARLLAGQLEPLLAPALVPVPGTQPSVTVSKQESVLPTPQSLRKTPGKFREYLQI